MDENETDAEFPEEDHSRWQLIRDVAVLQVKLLVDGIRDLVLVPVSLVAAAVGLLTRRDDPDHYFNQVMGIGRQSEEWIDLFGRRRGEEPKPDTASMDQLLGAVEQQVVRHYQRGGLTRSGKQAVDSALDTVQRVIAADKQSATPGETDPPPPLLPLPPGTPSSSERSES